MADNISCALILLAAGASVRMGRPKQLLLVDGQSLLRRIAERALASPVNPVVVVLGANAAEIAPSLAGLPVRTVVNPEWAEGLGSSLRIGVELLASFAPETAGVIVTLADHPDFSVACVQKLIDAQRVTRCSIVASEHEGVRGPPVLFAAKHFPALRALRGDTGARGLLQAHASDVASVPLGPACDLDTPADYAAYLRRSSPRKN